MTGYDFMMKISQIQMISCCLGSSYNIAAHRMSYYVLNQTLNVLASSMVIPLTTDDQINQHTKQWMQQYTQAIYKSIRKIIIRMIPMLIYLLVMTLIIMKKEKLKL